MPLLAGDKLGPYEILAAIGAGGMGEVYKARDTRLDRTVAVKVLPEHIAKRDDLRARFEREARAVASLNHPNICVLHDIGNQAGTGYMVMEFMEGETLAQRIEKGPIPLAQALPFATQIADALDRAHRAGVTHRDVKPQNIILTRDGVKVLDFGLAKSSAAPGPTDATLTQALTAEGTVLGTPQYMAPEQFEGKEADARADIWAFGAVLYEMVTGRKAFQGKSYSSLVGAILSTDPAPMAVEPFTPAWLERLARRCLAKDPEERYQSMRDIVLDLRQPPSEEAGGEVPASGWNWTVMVAAGACLALGLLAGGLWMRGRAGSEPIPGMFEVNSPAGSPFSGITDGGGSALSPDGRTLAFTAASSAGGVLLYVRPLQSREARALPGTEGAARPFWSPDSKSLGFVADAKLKRVELTGGLPVTLCETRFARGGTWSEDGVILIGDSVMPLRRIPASGGTPSPVTQLAAGEVSHYYPQFLPGGKQFLYLATLRDATADGRRGAIFAGSLDGQAGTRLVETPYRAVYDAGSGRLLYLTDSGTLLAQRLELNPPRLTGEPVKVAEGIGVTTSNRYAEFSVSNTGILVFGQRNGAGQLLQFGWRDRAGKLLEPLGPSLPARLWFDLSPDNNRFLYYAETKNGSSEVWMMETASGLRTRVTFEGGSNPLWSPDGKFVYYPAREGILRRAIDGSGGAEKMLDNPNRSGARGFLFGVSPDGQHLLFGDRDIQVLSLTGERKAKPYVATKASEQNGVFSPDGRWVAYESDESGRHEVYVQGFPERGGKGQISAEGGRFPQWRADGKEIYWVRPDGMLMAASVELKAGAPRAGRAEPLFVVSDAGGFPNYRPSRDGKRFLVLDPLQGMDMNPPKVVFTNWAAGLER